MVCGKVDLYEILYILLMNKKYLYFYKIYYVVSSSLIKS